ncbi:MAG: urea amidolyase [Boseongicola sp.]|nr:MAG: urea amidolyase [Boseongicola sp.]
MTVRLDILEAGPGLSLQDQGRPGHIGIGLSPGGAADRDALLHGQTLLQNPPEAPALEMAGFGGKFRALSTTRIALTGATMRATLNSEAIEPNTTFAIHPGDTLQIGAAISGVFGYLHIAGGFTAQEALGGRGYHGIAGLGALCQAGDILTAPDDPTPDAPRQRLTLPKPKNDAIRIMNGPQTALFPEETRRRFEETIFTRSPRGNRQGVRLDQTREPFSTGGQLTLTSDFIAAGDIQMTGDGTPYVLMADCQTMGGYPRIGTVLPADLPRIAQAQPGTKLTFRFVSLEQAEAAWQSDDARRAAFAKACTPLIRDPHEMGDLLSYELISRPVED